jgi:hypothetical protein
MVHVPSETKVTVLSDTVHTGAVSVAKDTFKPELAVALSSLEVSEKSEGPGSVNVIVCAPLATVKVLVTGTALLLLVLPVWRAVMLQVPAVSIVAVQVRLPIAPELETVQTAVEFEAKVTSSPDVEVPVRVIGASPSSLDASSANVMICVALAIVMEVVIVRAAKVLELPG